MFTDVRKYVSRTCVELLGHDRVNHSVISLATIRVLPIGEINPIMTHLLNTNTTIDTLQGQHNYYVILTLILHKIVIICLQGNIFFL